MELNIEITHADWTKFNKYVQKSEMNGPKPSGKEKMKSIFLWLISFVYTFVIFRFFEFRNFHWPTALFILSFIILFIITWIYFFFKLKKSLVPLKNGVILGTTHYIIDEQGIHSEGNGVKSFHSWKRVLSIEYGNNLVMCFIDSIVAFIFPEDQIENVDTFISELQSLKKIEEQ